MDSSWEEKGYRLYLHSRTLLSASKSADPYSWWHPSASHQGDHPPKDFWWELDCWLSDDVAEHIDQVEKHVGVKLSVPAYSDLIGEIDALISDAQFGQLRQVDKRDHWAPGYGVERCASVPGVAEIKAKKPFYVNDVSVKIRIYYSEPESKDILLSLGFQLKQVDDPDWKTVQNEAISLAQQRGDDWVTRQGQESTA